MIGIKHAIVVSFGILGLIIGGVMIDLDHEGTWNCKFTKFFSRNIDCYTKRGPLHNPILMLSVALFCLMLGIGLLMHYIMDYISLT